MFVNVYDVQNAGCYTVKPSQDLLDIVFESVENLFIFVQIGIDTLLFLISEKLDLARFPFLVVWEPVGHIVELVLVFRSRLVDKSVNDSLIQIFKNYVKESEIRILRNLARNEAIKCHPTHFWPKEHEIIRYR